MVKCPNNRSKKNQNTTLFDIQHPLWYQIAYTRESNQLAIPLYLFAMFWGWQFWIAHRTQYICFRRQCLPAKCLFDRALTCSHLVRASFPGSFCREFAWVLVIGILLTLRFEWDRKTSCLCSLCRLFFRKHKRSVGQLPINIGYWAWYLFHHQVNT